MSRLAKTDRQPRTPGQSKALNRSKAAALLLIASAIGLLLVELICRLFLPQWAPPKAQNVSFWRYDAVLGWAHEPRKEGRFVHRDFSTQVVINSLGLRDREYPLTPAEGKRRVLLLGDSFGWGYGVEQNETIDALLEEKYSDLEVINASVAGYGTDQQWLYLRDSGLDLRPDLVLLLFHPNDVGNNSHSQQYDYEKPIFDLSGGKLVLGNAPVPHRWSGQLRRWSLNKTYFPRTLLQAARRISKPEVEPAKNRQAGLEITEALLLEMRQTVTAAGAEFWVAGIPWPGGEPRKIVQHFRDFALAHKMRYISLEEAFDEATEEIFYPHTQHWTPYGQALAAGVIEADLWPR